jgi:hypothetical protein
MVPSGSHPRVVASLESTADIWDHLRLAANSFDSALLRTYIRKVGPPIGTVKGVPT